MYLQPPTDIGKSHKLQNVGTFSTNDDHVTSSNRKVSTLVKTNDGHVTSSNKKVSNMIKPKKTLPMPCHDTAPANRPRTKVLEDETAVTYKNTKHVSKRQKATATR